MSSTRADRIAGRLPEGELDALLVTDLVNLHYLTGFTGTSGACLMGPELRLFFTDFRYVERARAELRDGFDVLRAGRELLGSVAERLSGRVGFEDHRLSVRTHARLVELAGERAELVPAGGLVEELRAVKDETELRSMREAAKLGDAVYEELASWSLEGRTERDVAHALELRMYDLGGERPAFPTIVAAGADAAQPHAQSRDAVIGGGELVIVDLGCVVDGYCSDCTRTLASGPIGGEAGEAYELVLEAQARGLEAVAPGAECREVDAAARRVIDGAGQGERFGHGLGHGVGLEVHEQPRLTPSAEGRLQAGNVVTVEPAVYASGEFGVRIEDLVVVADGGHEVLSRFSKRLTITGT